MAGSRGAATAGCGARNQLAFFTGRAALHGLQYVPVRLGGAVAEFAISSRGLSIVMMLG